MMTSERSTRKYMRWPRSLRRAKFMIWSRRMMNLVCNRKKCHQILVVQRLIWTIMWSRVHYVVKRMRDRRKRSLPIAKKTKALTTTSLRSPPSPTRIVRAHRCVRANCWVMKLIMTRILRSTPWRKRGAMGIATPRLTHFTWPSLHRIRANMPNSRSWGTASVSHPESCNGSFTRKSGRPSRSTSTFRPYFSISRFWSSYFTNAIGGSSWSRSNKFKKRPPSTTTSPRRHFLSMPSSGGTDTCSGRLRTGPSCCKLTSMVQRCSFSSTRYSWTTSRSVKNYLPMMPTYRRKIPRSSNFSFGRYLLVSPSKRSRRMCGRSSCGSWLRNSLWRHAW